MQYISLKFWCWYSNSCLGGGGFGGGIGDDWMIGQYCNEWNDLKMDSFAFSSDALINDGLVNDGLGIIWGKNDDDKAVKSSLSFIFCFFLAGS